MTRPRLTRFGFLSRNDVLERTLAEKAITDAMAAVEDVGAHPLLTEAVTLLDQARNRVADFLEMEKP